MKQLRGGMSGIALYQCSECGKIKETAQSCLHSRPGRRLDHAAVKKVVVWVQYSENLGVR